MAKNEHLNSDIGKANLSMLHWDDTRVFLAIARCGTLNAAAHMMGIGVATVSRRIDRLEKSLGIPLFSRHQNGYQLTDDGTSLLPAAEAVEQAAQTFGAEAIGNAGKISGTVRLATAENLAVRLIIPSLIPLKKKHPHLQIDVATDVKTVNLHRRDADLAVRMVRPTRGNVTVRKLATLGYGLYGAADYVSRRENGPNNSRNNTQFETDSFIGWAEAYSHLPAAQWVERTLRGRPPAMTTSSLTAQVAAAQSGLGLAVIPHIIGQHAGLQNIEVDLGVSQSIWLILHTDLLASQRVRVVADHLTDLIHTHRDLLKGP